MFKKADALWSAALVMRPGVVIVAVSSWMYLIDLVNGLIRAALTWLLLLLPLLLLLLNTVAACEDHAERLVRTQKGTAGTMPVLMQRSSIVVANVVLLFLFYWFCAAY